MGNYPRSAACPVDDDDLYLPFLRCMIDERVRDTRAGGSEFEAKKAREERQVDNGRN